MYGLPPNVDLRVAVNGQNIHRDVNLPVGTTKEQAAVKAAAALDKEQDRGKNVTLHAVASGATVTVTEVRGAVITSLAVSIGV
jgi:hypothetical protein